jgi:hypothetical protein
MPKAIEIRRSSVIPVRHNLLHSFVAVRLRRWLRFTESSRRPKLTLRATPQAIRAQSRNRSSVATAVESSYAAGTRPKC